MAVLSAFASASTHASTGPRLSQPSRSPSDRRGPMFKPAVTVIGRRDRRHDKRWPTIDLTRADLAGADLAGARLTGADLTGADLGGADLTRADLGGADLTRADLGGAD